MKTLTKKNNYITDIFWQIKKETDINRLLEDILTPQEIETLYERFQIIKLLKQWLSQRQVAEKLNLSTTTVNRGAKILKYWNWILNDLKL